MFNRMMTKLKCHSGWSFLPSLMSVTIAFLLSTAAMANTSQRVVLELSPPHQTLENGQVAGLATAVMDEVLAKAALKPAYEVYPWARAYRIAVTTPDVIIYNIARTPERESQFEWIGEVTRYRFGFLKLATRQDIQIRQLADIQRYLVGAQRDDFVAEWLRDHARQPAEQLQLQPDVVETWRLLVNGKIDLMVDDPNAIADMLQQYQLKGSDIEFVLFVPELELRTWIALKKGSDPRLVRRLKQAHQQVVGGKAWQQSMGNQ